MPLHRWSPRRTATGATAERSFLQTARRRPVVLTDFTVRPYDVGSVRRIVEILAPSTDALLVGEHHNRPDFPPTQLAGLIQAAGGQPWLTLTCRDRNRVALEQELAGLAIMNVPGVLCVTGDARGGGTRRGVSQVFDLDGMRLAALAAELGLTVAVAESPAAHPAAIRALRLTDKEKAGATLAILNHVGHASDVARFSAEFHDAGGSLPLIASVALYTDARSAEVLARFPGLQVDAAQVAAVLDSADPLTAGIDAAVAEGRRLIEIEGVAGINISGLGSASGLEVAAEAKAEVGRRLLALADEGP